MFLYEVMSITHPKFTILRSGIFPPQKNIQKHDGRLELKNQAAVRELVDVELVASCEGGQLERRGKTEVKGRGEEILKSWEGKGNNSGNIGIFNIWDGPFFGKDSLKSSQMKKNMILIDILKFDGSCVHAWPMAYLIILSLKPTVCT